MDDLERLLRDLPLRAPSADLDKRVMDAKAGPRPDQHPTRRARRWIPALAAAALVALAGGFALRLATTPPVRQIENPAPTGSTVSANPFDFTRPSSIFPSGEVEVVIRSPKGN